MKVVGMAMLRKKCTVEQLWNLGTKWPQELRVAEPGRSLADLLMCGLGFKNNSLEGGNAWAVQTFWCLPFGKTLDFGGLWKFTLGVGTRSRQRVSVRRCQLPSLCGATWPREATWLHHRVLALMGMLRDEVGAFLATSVSICGDIHTNRAPRIIHPFKVVDWNESWAKSHFWTAETQESSKDDTTPRSLNLQLTLGSVKCWSLDHTSGMQKSWHLF